jgi:hypothetical protein
MANGGKLSNGLIGEAARAGEGQFLSEVAVNPGSSHI